MSQYSTGMTASRERHPGSSIQNNQSNQNKMTLDDLFDLAKARSTIIFGIALACGILAVLHCLFMPKYTAKTTLLVQRAENSPLQAMMGKMSGTSFLQTKQNDYQDKYFTFLESYEFRRSVARMMMENPDYAADRKVMTHRGFIGNILNAILYSQIHDVTSNEAEVEDLARALKAGKFSKKGMDNISVEFTSGDYHRAVRLVNFLAESAVSIIAAREIDELAHAKKFMEDQLAAADAHLRKFDEEIVKFRRKSKNITTDAVPQQVLQRIQGLKASIQDARLKREMNEKLIAGLTKELKDDNRRIIQSGAKTFRGSDVTNELHLQIQDLRYKRILLQAQGESEDSIQMKNLDRTIDKVTSEIKSTIHREGGTEDDVASLLRDNDGLVVKIHSLKRENQYFDAQLDTFSKALEKETQPLDALPEAVQTLVGFNRGSQSEYQLLQQMKGKLLEIEVEQISLRSKIQVLEQATIAGIPVRWSPFTNFVIAFVLALVAGFIGCYGVEVWDMTIKNRLELEGLGLVTIGSVPRIKATLFETIGAAFAWLPAFRQNIKFENQVKKGSIDILKTWRTGSRDAPEVMAFNHIRARIIKMRSPQGDPAKVVAIMSSKPGEGKSFIASNVALSLAQLDKKVLLLDCDLRRSSVPEKLGVSNELGLGAVLGQNLPFEDCIIKDLMPNFDVLSGGSSVKRPTELISGPAFSAFIQEIRPKYDFIIIDTPPVLPVVDSLIIASLSDALIMSVNYRKTKWKECYAAIEKIHSMDDKPIFAVFNQVPEVHEYIYISTPSRTVPRASGEGVPRGANNPNPPVVSPAIDVKAGIKRFKETIQKGSVDV